MAIDKQYLGDFLTCESAVVEARKQFWQTGSCTRCMDVLSEAETVRIAQLYFEFPPGRTART
jgi:hypothetical protein